MLEANGKGRALKIAKSLAIRTGSAAKGCLGKRKIGRWTASMTDEGGSSSKKDGCDCNQNETQWTKKDIYTYAVDVSRQETSKPQGQGHDGSQQECTEQCWGTVPTTHPHLSLTSHPKHRPYVRKA